MGGGTGRDRGLLEEAQGLSVPNRWRTLAREGGSALNQNPSLPSLLTLRAVQPSPFTDLGFFFPPLVLLLAELSSRVPSLCPDPPAADFLPPPPPAKKAHKLLWAPAKQSQRLESEAKLTITQTKLVRAEERIDANGSEAGGKEEWALFFLRSHQVCLFF